MRPLVRTVAFLGCAVVVAYGPFPPAGLEWFRCPGWQRLDQISSGALYLQVVLEYTSLILGALYLVTGDESLLLSFLPLLTPETPILGFLLTLLGPAALHVFGRSSLDDCSASAEGMIALLVLLLCKSVDFLMVGQTKRLASSLVLEVSIGLLIVLAFRYIV